LGAVLHRQPPRGAGAGIDEPSALLEPRLGGERRALDRGTHRPHGRHRRELTFDHRVENVGRIPDVDPGIARTGPLGLHALTYPQAPAWTTHPIRIRSCALATHGR